MKILAITQARYSSSRLPGKVLKRIEEYSLLEIHLKRILKSQKIEQLIVATTFEKESKSIIEVSKKLGVESFQGDMDDVLDRFYKAASQYHPEYVVRLTSDCPLIDADLIDNIIDFVVENNLDYGSNTLQPSFPDGLDVEVFKFHPLKEAWQNATLKSEREHVTPYIWKNSSFCGGQLYKSDNYMNETDLSNVRLTVDQPEDFEVIKNLILEKGISCNWKIYSEHYLQMPSIHNLNEEIKRNEGYLKSIKKDTDEI